MRTWPIGEQARAAARPLIAALAGLVASCAEPAATPSYPVQVRPWPTLTADPPRGVRLAHGLAVLRGATIARAIELEVGRENATLLAFDCVPDEPGLPSQLGRRSRSPLALRAPRACYRCVMPLLDAGPQDPYGPPARDRELRAIARALTGYPDSFVRTSQIDRLTVCDRLVDETHADPSIAGLADNRRRRILIELGSSMPVAMIVHHEVFHLFDSATASEATDAAWDAANPPGFDYGEPPIASGFLDAYSQTSAHEDRATVFESIMSDGAAFCARAATDPVIRAKGALIRDRIAAALPARDAAFVDRAAPCLAPRR